MNNEEKFGVSLELIIDKFKQKASEASDYVKRLSKQVQEKSKFEPTFSTSIYRQEGENIEDYYNRLNKVQNTHFSLEQPKTETKKFGNELNKTSKDIDNFSNKIDETNKKIENTPKIFDKGITSIKRFSLSLLGVGSAFTLFSQARATYNQENDYMRAKSEVTSSVLANSLAPAIKFVADVTQYAVIGLAKLISIFTGTNVLANVTTKNLNKTSNATKSLNKNLLSLDEITNLTDNNNLTSGIQNDLKALEELQDKIKKVEGLFDKLSKTSLGKFIGGAIDWFKKLPPEAQMVTGALAGVTLALKGTGGLIPTLTMLALTTFTVKVAYDSVLNAIRAYKDLQKAIEDLNPVLDKNAEKDKEVANSFLELYNAGKLTEGAIRGVIQVELDKINSGRGTIEEIMNNISWHERFIGISENTQKTLLKSIEANYSYAKSAIAMHDANSMNKEETEKLKSTIESQIGTLENARTKLNSNSDAYKKNEQMINDLRSELLRLKNGNYDTETTVKVKTDTGEAKKGLSKFFSGIASFGSSVLNTLGFTNINSILGKINSFDVGTDYVPNDQLAVVHKGEKIIPKKFNSETYFNNNNAETNALLRELLYETKNNDRTPVLNINSREFARATYQDYKDEASRDTSSTIIRRS